MYRQKNLPEPLLPGIPSAPKGKRFNTAAEVDYQRRKRLLAHRLPALKPEDLIGTLEQPFYQILLHDLMSTGNSKVADEINNLLRKEERDRKSGKLKARMGVVKLIDQPEILNKIADTLKMEQTLLAEGKKESAMLICKQLADSFLLQERSVWLARHFYLAVLHRCRKICPESTTRLQSEIHCLLAYIARENNENLEAALAVAIDHLAVCRTLSRDQSWQFKPNTIMIKLKRPIAFYGVNDPDVYETVDACTMSIYMIASLLEHELLISLANQIMHSPHHKAPTDDDLKNALEFADLALQLALEVRQPVALSSALTRFGIVLRHVGAFDDAMGYFHQLQQHAFMTGDVATEAIAYHNLGLCFNGMYNSVDALDCFAKQRELATSVQTKELEGNSMHEIGHLLLQEGHLWEAEECYLVAFENFYNATKARHSLNHSTYHLSQGAKKSGMDVSQGHTDHESHHHESVNRTEIAWAMAGVAAGQKQWSRLAGLCRSEEAKDLRSVVQFKCSRKPLSAVVRPDYTVMDISEMEKPWEGAEVSLAVSVTDEVPSVSETSWEEGFAFAGGKAVERKRGSVKKVGFGATVLEGGLEGGEPQMSVEEAMNELKELIDAAEEEKRRMEMSKGNKTRASAFMEKDKRMRQSMSGEVGRRSSLAMGLDRKPTSTTVGSSGGDGGGGEK